MNIDEKIPEIDNQKLMRSWERARTQRSEQNELALYFDLKQAAFLVPLKHSGKGAEGGEEQGYELMILRTQENEAFIPAFTDRAELEKWPFAREAVALIIYDGLKHRVMDASPDLTGVVINPFGGNLALRRKDLELIDSRTEGMSAARVEHSGKMILSRPKAIPDGLTDAFRRFCAKELRIEQAYILLSQGEQEEEPHWLFLLEFEGERTEIFPKAAEVIRPYMQPNSSFELMRAGEDLARQVAEKNEPVYRREGTLLS